MGLLKDIIKEGWFRRGKTESLSIDDNGWKELFEKKTTVVVTNDGTAFQISIPDGKSIDSLTEKDLEIVELPYVPNDKADNIFDIAVDDDRNATYLSAKKIVFVDELNYKHQYSMDQIHL